MKTEKTILIYIIVILTFILAWRALSIWEYTTAQRTMFEYAKGNCEMRGASISCK